MRKFIILVIVGLIVSCNSTPTYKDKSAPIDRRVADLLGRMTPEEKFFQLFMIPFDGDSIKTSDYKNGMFGFQVSASSSDEGGTGILSYNSGEDQLALARKINRIQKHFIEETRLGIPVIFFDEALHGLVRKGATSFPQSIALAATFDTTLMADIAEAIAVETKSRGIRQVLSPVVNIATDVRWGRTEETYGEDPFLATSMGVAFVGEFERRNIITTPKHFVANVGDGGRDSYPVDFNERLLQEYHFPAFQTCIKVGGSRSIMTSYNSLNGEPNSQNDWLLRKKLKQDWGFEGFVISDANAVGGANVLHMTSGGYGMSGKQAIESGLDVIFQTSYHHYGLYIQPFLEDSVAQERIDDAVSRVLRAKFELGLFENPYVDESEPVDISKHKKLALKAAVESLVLLKNERNALPLSENVATVAIIGNDAMEARLGGYSGPGNGKVSILTAMDSLVERVIFTEGCGREEAGPSLITDDFLSDGNGNRGLKGEYFKNTTLAGNPAVVRADNQINFSWTLYPPDPKIESHFYSVRWTGELRAPRSGLINIGLEGNDGYRLFINDSLIVDHWRKQSYTRSMKLYRFEKDKSYAIRVEFYESVGNASIKLMWQLQTDDTEAKIREAIQAARQSDVAIIVAGIQEGEFRDRAKLSLPGRQEEMIKRVSATGVPTVVVLIGGSAITMNNWIGDVDAVLLGWYPGEEGGTAIAKTLMGEYNPGGKLPITFPLYEGQLPLVYNHKPTGRGDDYLNLSGKPLFPFGFGLTYTTFEYSNLRFSKETIKKEESIQVEFDLENTGDRAGDEVVQLYIKDVVASVVRPVMELKGFRRIQLEPGEKRTMKFDIKPEMLSVLSIDLDRVVEPGQFRIMIGASSNDIRLAGEIEVVE